MRKLIFSGRYSGTYSLKEAAVSGDILEVQTKKEIIAAKWAVVRAASRGIYFPTQFDMQNSYPKRP